VAKFLVEEARRQTTGGPHILPITPDLPAPQGVASTFLWRWTCYCVTLVFWWLLNRFLRIRTDRHPEEASGPDLVEQLYKKQNRRIMAPV